MKVFITGGTGFIGSHIVVELLSRGDEVTILARNPRKIPAFANAPGVTMVEGGLDDRETIRAALPGHEACIHAALYWDDAPTELELKDTRASVNLFESAAEAGVKQLLYTSSTAVHRPFRPHMDELDRLTPTDFYAATKAAGEAFLSAFSYQTEMRCNVIRPGPTVGVPAVDGAPVNVFRPLNEIVRAAKAGEEIRVAKHDGRQFVAAADLAKLYSAVLRSQANRETYLGLAHGFMLWEEIAREAVSLVGSTSRVIVEETGLDPTPKLFDVTKIEREFGFVFRATSAMMGHLQYLTR